MLGLKTCGKGKARGGGSLQKIEESRRERRSAVEEEEDVSMQMRGSGEIFYMRVRRRRTLNKGSERHELWMSERVK